MALSRLGDMASSSSWCALRAGWTTPSGRLCLDRLGSAWIGMDPGLGWKPAHTGVSAHVDAELRIWLTPGWSQTRSNHVNPREKEISSPEAGTLLPPRDSASAPAARDSATAPDSPARATPPLALEKGFQYTAAADEPAPFSPCRQPRPAVAGGSGLESDRDGGKILGSPRS
ncbi:hypothetical protein SORBI_3001G410900 [Sorghum bicolor]|uniref:Uncharacterized protein n=1 Tax=Sorghum bicolor TaxID=4558 RepID=A0A1B6QNZ0_SORBI|nr:hypothetical protein SORBI_3001G410900 [Sorghum bicolor]